MLAISLAVVLTGCHKVGPQSPANIQDEDTTGIALSMLNMRLAAAADQQITTWVQQQDTAYTLEDYGYWYCFYRRTEGTPIEELKKVELYYTTSTLDGRLIEDCQTTVTVGRRETLWAIDNILPMMKEGEAVRIASPYYTAYGKEGTERVEPLTNCIIDISDVRLTD